MNWYKIAQKNPDILSTLSEANNKAWVDPQGVVYPMQGKMTHSKWMQNNFDFLREKYNYKHLGGNWTSVESLVAQGWMRFLPLGLGVHFVIDSFSNTNQLKEIEEYLFSAFNDKYYVVIRSLEGQEVEFDWEDFIESGESFSDFIKKHKR